MEKWTSGCVTERILKDHELLKAEPFQCSGCRKITTTIHRLTDGRGYCTATCYMKYNPMELTGDTTRLDAIAKETADNRCIGRGRNI